MDIKGLFNDDSAVSPVIGVILMVAITVILAAVIATFVLGLGDSVSNTAPQASFSIDYESGTSITVTHEGGDSIKASELYVRGTIGNNDWNSLGGTSGKVQAGNSITISGATDSYDVRVVYQSSEGDTSATLAQSSGPSA